MTEVTSKNLTRIIFQGGLNWKVNDKKWPNFIKTFKEFSIKIIADFTESDVKKLIHDSRIVRNKSKIIATINNAKQFQKIKQEFGSFQNYMDSLDKSDNMLMP